MEVGDQPVLINTWRSAGQIPDIYNTDTIIRT